MLSPKVNNLYYKLEENTIFILIVFSNLVLIHSLQFCQYLHTPDNLSVETRKSYSH